LIHLLHAHFPRRTFLLGISEAFLVTLAFVVAAIALMGATNANFMLSHQRGLFKILVISAAFVTCIYYFDLYDSAILSNRRVVIARMVQVLGTTYLFLAIVYYLYPPLHVGRGIFLLGFILVAVLLLLGRHLFLALTTLPRFAKRALILGDGPLAESLKMEFASRLDLGVRVVGRLNGEAFRRRALTCQPDNVIVAMNDWRGNLPLEALLKLRSRGVTIQDGAELYEAITGKIPIRCFRSSCLIFSDGLGARPRFIYERVGPLVFSALALLLTLPVMALIALAIRLDSAGPVIFRQRRVGQHGKVFTLYKFRTMVDGADTDDNCRPAEIADRRCTRVGRFLRRARIDELPQLFNILRGEMGFVGPRPFVPNQERQLAERIPHYRQRWLVKPGATGWAQVNRGYCVTIEDNQEKLAYDLFYIKNGSLGLDLLILFKTIKLVLLGRGGR